MRFSSVLFKNAHSAPPRRASSSTATTTRAQPMSTQGAARIQPRSCLVSRTRRTPPVRQAAAPKMPISWMIPARSMASLREARAPLHHHGGKTSSTPGPSARGALSGAVARGESGFSVLRPRARIGTLRVTNSDPIDATDKVPPPTRLAGGSFFASRPGAIRHARVIVEGPLLEGSSMRPRPSPPARDLRR